MAWRGSATTIGMVKKMSALSSARSSGTTASGSMGWRASIFKMTILCVDLFQAEQWVEGLRSELPEVEVRLWPEMGNPEDVEMVVLSERLDVLSGLPNLKAMVVAAAGVEHVVTTPDRIPPGIQVTRLADHSITAQMIEWVLFAMLLHTRRWDDYRELQQARRYEELAVPAPKELAVAVLGIGVLGGGVATTLSSIGYRVRGWSRSPKSIPGIECFHGASQWDACITGCDVIVCLLPLTADTQAILDSAAFAKMKTGGYVINAARGAHMVESDLIAALDSGQLSGATLDVQVEEPMAHANPLWSHPKIRITPHIAAYCYPRYCAPQVAENYRRLQAGEPLMNVVDMSRQY